MKHLTVRGLPDELSAALADEKKRRGTSLNQTVIDLLQRALGMGAEPHDNGLGRFAGSWSEEDIAEFEARVVELEHIDDDLWL